MNLLTDIIQDVAKEIGIELSDEQKMTVQHNILSAIMREVSWLKHELIAREPFPWLDHGK